ncbi:hypothetical protein, partial [Pseudomonas aeruginosa]|uniref:hypothetical protein n=1 Tax=Pseudomonas aeruginosa TaxID=287 RepID=UPI0022372C36
HGAIIRWLPGWLFHQILEVKFRVSLTIDCRGRSCCMGVLFKFKNILFGNRVLFLGLIVVKKESVTGKT